MAEFLKLKKSECKNCYKCIRHCPVKSIKFSGNRAYVVHDECILCGQCYVVCPQNAGETLNETDLVYSFLRDKSTPVIVSLAPSFLAYFENTCLTTMTDALLKLGFDAVEETAIGATMVKREYERLIKEKFQDIIITSCCHSVNLLIGKYYPDAMKYLAPIVSPMQAHCQSIKQRYPNAKTVFIGPCLSKKDEAFNNGIVDAVLTFSELAVMLNKEGIVVAKGSDNLEHSKARLFPIVGGILKTMDLSDNSYSYITVDGTENCKAALEDIIAGNIKHCFIEMNACPGGCVGGPVMDKFRHSPIRHIQAIMNYAGEKDFEVGDYDKAALVTVRPDIALHKKEPSEGEIWEILKQTGKTKPSDMLNCGTCGYNTCREKAIAVWQGKADINMCLPYLMEKTERLSDNILRNTPNGIIVVNEDLRIRQINHSALEMFNAESCRKVIGEEISKFLNPLPFVKAAEDGMAQTKRQYYAEYNKYFELTVIHDSAIKILIAIVCDVTDEENERRQKEQISVKTMEIADKVVDKQMRIVQEIASLLGETAAETKIALTKLKESISGDEK